VPGIQVRWRKFSVFARSCSSSEPQAQGRIRGAFADTVTDHRPAFGTTRQDKKHDRLFFFCSESSNHHSILGSTFHITERKISSRFASLSECTTRVFTARETAEPRGTARSETSAPRPMGSFLASFPPRGAPCHADSKVVGSKNAFLATSVGHFVGALVMHVVTRASIGVDPVAKWL